jgi:polyhydroxybutyrate depolymerase
MGQGGAGRARVESPRAGAVDPAWCSRGDPASTPARWGRLSSAAVVLLCVACGGGETALGRAADAGPSTSTSASGGGGGSGSVGGEGGASAGSPGGAGGAGGGTGTARDAGQGGAPGDADAAAPSAGCDPSQGLLPGDYDFKLTHDGVEYGYLVHVPAGYDPAARTPLVLNWHGLTSSAAQQRFFSAMNPVADAHRFIVVYPNSPDGSWNAGACCAFLSPDRDDVGFALALIEEMKGRACVDDRRVYSTGMSNGGYMSHRLACEHADVFAAVAPVAGTLSIDTCAPSRPIAVMHFHGTADKNVPYDGDGIKKAASVPETMQAWADRDGCAPQPTVTFAQDDATCETWTGCDGGVEVTLCTFEGEGHCWPGQAFCPFGAATTTLNASEEAAKFFERFHL